MHAIHPAKALHSLAPALSEAGDVAIMVLRMAGRAALFGRPHRLIDSAIAARSPAFAMASVMYFGAAVLRHSMLGGTPVHTVLAVAALYYVVLLAISLGGRTAEMMMCMSVSIGCDLIVCGLIAMGMIEPGAATASRWIFGWELSAMFIAMCRLRLSRLASHAA